jgi:hypothetical protein
MIFYLVSVYHVRWFINVKIVMIVVALAVIMENRQRKASADLFT